MTHKWEPLVIKTCKRKPFVNNTCIGCSACASISGDVFEMNMETGFSDVRELPDYEGMDVDDAIMACPVNAISWQEVPEAK